MVKLICFNGGIIRRSSSTGMLIPYDWQTPVLTSISYALLFILCIRTIGGSTNRHKPSTIIKRLLGALLGCFLVLTHLVFYHKWYFNEFDFKLVYLTSDGLVWSIFWAIVSTEALYLGQWYDDFVYDFDVNWFKPMHWIAGKMDLLTFRNLIAAPITEEFVFRCCILYHMRIYFYYSCTASYVATGLIFSVAHSHHIFEDILDGVGWREAVISGLVQMSYTLLFGTYATYLLLRTGNMASAVVVHALCNYHGLPDVMTSVSLAKTHPNPGMAVCRCLAFYAAGLAAWAIIVSQLMFRDPTRFPNGAQCP